LWRESDRCWLVEPSPAAANACKTSISGTFLSYISPGSHFCGRAYAL
jgi:hypothetical protein